jgi:Transposase DDE domain
LILTLLVMTWCCGDSQAERFETAKGFVAACLIKRRRPGQTVQGFQKALAKLPLPVLRALAAGVRRRLLSMLDLTSDGFTALGCDGSSLDCPRVEELERRLDPPLKAQGAPQVWVTALVHLRTGLLWSWHLGKGYNRERSHLRALLGTLPAAALVVADAGYNGYELAQAIIASGAAFLIRATAKDMLYTEQPLSLADFTTGEVLCWPKHLREKNRLPLRVRLIRLRGNKPNQDVWLLTNVLEPERLSTEMASRYYRWRWENEGLFRTYKRTLTKFKVMSRTIALVHREVEGALLATQLLLAQGVRAVSASTTPTTALDAPKQLPTQNLPRVSTLTVGSRLLPCSPRKVLLVIRAVILGRTGIRQREQFRRLLSKALREQRQRRSFKVKRAWPRKYDHKPPKPPEFLTLTEEHKALLAKLLKTAARSIKCRH